MTARHRRAERRYHRVDRIVRFLQLVLARVEKVHARRANELWLISAHDSTLLDFGRPVVVAGCGCEQCVARRGLRGSGKAMVVG